MYPMSYYTYMYNIIGLIHLGASSSNFDKDDIDIANSENFTDNINITH